MASPTATPIPCSTPTKATVSSVMMASPNSHRSNLKIETSCPTWKSRVATKMRIAANVARGTSLRSPAAGTTSTTPAAAASPASWVRPPADATAAVRAGLALTANDPASTRHDASRADPDEVAVDLDRVSTLVREGACGGGALAENDEGHHRRDGHHLAERGERQVGQSEVRRAVSDGAEHGDPVGPKSRRSDDGCRADQANQGPGDLAIDSFGDHDDGEDRRAEAHRPPIGVTEMTHDFDDAMHRRSRHGR